MPPSDPKVRDIKRLFALSGNQCAFPGCGELMVNENGDVLGQICHIEAAQPGGQRYNGNSNDKYRSSFENLILFCSKHHIITNDVNLYSSLKLHEYKLAHEKKFHNAPIDVSDSIVEQAIRKNMDQKSSNTGTGFQFNNQAETQGPITQIGEQHNYYHHPESSNKPSNKKKSSKYLKPVIALTLLTGFIITAFVVKSALERSSLKKIIHSYYQDMNGNKFLAGNYLAPNVSQYILVKNYTPHMVDSLIREQCKEFLYRSASITESSFEFAKDPDGNNAVDFWIKFHCYRKSKAKYETCLVHEEFVFNPNNKIISVRELQLKGLEYSFTDN